MQCILLFAMNAVNYLLFFFFKFFSLTSNGVVILCAAMGGRY